MELFSVVLTEKEDPPAQILCQWLQKDLQAIIDNGQTLKIEWDKHENFHKICCRGNVKVNSLNDTVEQIRYKLSSALSDYIMEYREKHLILQMMNYYAFDYSPTELEKIEKYAVQLLDEGNFVEPSQEFRFKRKNRLFHKIYSYLLDHSTIHLEGFMQFRLSDYRQELTEVLEHAIDEYLMDREYQEFISLLRYFVLVQQPKLTEVHVCHTSAGFELKNPDFTPLDLENFEMFVKDVQDQDIRLEDMIVSALISASPARVVIHTHQSEHNVVKTISNIFQNRSELCSSCDLCSSFSSKSGTGMTLNGIDFS